MPVFQVTYFTLHLCIWYMVISQNNSNAKKCPYESFFPSYSLYIISYKQYPSGYIIGVVILYCTVTFDLQGDHRLDFAFLNGSFLQCLLFVHTLFQVCSFFPHIHISAHCDSSPGGKKQQQQKQ